MLPPLAKSKQCKKLPSACLLLGVLDQEDGDSMFLRNVLNCGATQHFMLKDIAAYSHLCEDPKSKLNGVLNGLLRAVAHSLLSK
jgi:hypothetical protein